MLLSDCLMMAQRYDVVSFQHQGIGNTIFCVCFSTVELHTLEGKCHTFGNDTRNVRQRVALIWVQLVFPLMSKSYKIVVFISSTRQIYAKGCLPLCETLQTQAESSTHLCFRFICGFCKIFVKIQPPPPNSLDSICVTSSNPPAFLFY